MTRAQRERFDRLLERVLETLPRALHELIEKVPVVVDDAPDKALMNELDEDDPEALLGLHSGTPFTEETVEASGELPADIRLFREGIVAHAGGWEGTDADERVREEIRVTLLHEIGHQFGLDEGDLERLGYD